MSPRPSENQDKSELINNKTRAHDNLAHELNDSCGIISFLHLIQDLKVKTQYSALSQSTIVDK